MQNFNEPPISNENEVMVGNLSFETTDEDLGGFFDEKCENMYEKIRKI